MNSGRDPDDLPGGLAPPDRRPGIRRAGERRAAALIPLAALLAAVVSATAPTGLDAAEQSAKAKPTRPAGPATSVRAGDVYWLQVGAFRDGETAARVAQRLREQKYPVHESLIARPSTAGSTGPPAKPPAPPREERDRYELVVTGGSTSEVEARLTAKGLTSRPASEGAVVTPGLPLGEAVALSKDLSGDGMAVRVQRMDNAVPGAARSQSGASETLHRVRVGSFPDRAAAEAALSDLRSRGYRPVLTRGDE